MPNDKTNIEELELGMVGETEEAQNEELTVDVEVTEDTAETVTLDAESEVEIPPTEGTEDESNEAEEAEEAEAEVEEEVEEAEVEEVADDESDDDEDESDEDDPLAETLASLQKQIESLTDTVKELTEANASLKKTNRKLSNKLQSEKAKKEAFLETAKGLSVALLPNEDKKEEPKKEKVDHSAYYNGDGIGEL